VSEPIVWLTFFVLSVFVGIEVISKVSSTLHTPLMSGANAIHHGLEIVFLAAALMSLVGAFFSAIRGERYVHVDESVEAEAAVVRA
jgi:NAD/NADP transhydrogenase alpha subunit